VGKERGPEIAVSFIEYFFLVDLESYICCRMAIVSADFGRPAMLVCLRWAGLELVRASMVNLALGLQWAYG
jgi:hypothetical protein